MFPFSVSEFKLVFNEIVVGTFLLYECGMVACFNYFPTVNDDYLICVFDC